MHFGGLRVLRHPSAHDDAACYMSALDCPDSLQAELPDYSIWANGRAGRHWRPHWPHATAGEPQPAPNRPQTPPGNAGGEEGTTQPPEISGAASTPPGLAAEDTAPLLPPEPAPDTPAEEEEARAHTIHLLGEAQRIEISSEEEAPVERSTREV